MNRGVDVAHNVAAEAVERDRESIKNSDVEAAHPELDQGIGVTKIEALCEFGFRQVALTDRLCIWQRLAPVVAMGCDRRHCFRVLAVASDYLDL